MQPKVSVETFPTFVESHVLIGEINSSCHHLLILFFFLSFFVSFLRPTWR